MLSRAWCLVPPLGFSCCNALQNASPEVVKVLAGNKCEVNTQQRAVDKERGVKVRTHVNKYEVFSKVCLYMSSQFLAAKSSY